MDNTKIRTIFYRRAQWYESYMKPIEFYLKDAHESFKQTKQRTFSHGNGEIQGLQFEIKDIGLFLHIAYYIPNQPTSIVPYPSNANKIDVKPLSPPEEFNFMEGDIFVMIKDNHLILCPSGARETIADHYIKYILRKKGLGNLIGKFSIEKIADINKLKLIKEEGVKRIVLNASIYEASLKYLERKTIKGNLLKSIYNELFEILSIDDNKLDKIPDKENLMVKIELFYDSRKKDSIFCREKLEETANKIINDDEEEGFSIYTTTGKRISANEIRVNKKIKVKTRGNSIDTKDAWNNLKNYYIELKELGILEQ